MLKNWYSQCIRIGLTFTIALSLLGLSVTNRNSGVNIAAAQNGGPGSVTPNTNFVNRQ